MKGTPDTPSTLAARLGPDVRHEVKVLADGEWFRFVGGGRVLGSGADWAEAFSDARRELERPVRIQQAVEAATRGDG